ncbi:MAG: TolC family protein [Ignavibacteriaceae bacterium]|nr:TolC family protein [Ignavibacteriaceae bacterium]
MKIRFLILYILLFLSQGIYSQNKGVAIDLKKAVDFTIQRYPLISQLNRQVDAVDAKVDQLKSNYLPSVDADLSYARVGPVQVFQFGSLSAQLYPENNYDAHVGLGYTVYDFGKRDAMVDLVSSGKNTALDNVEMAKTNLAYQAVQAYYSILFLRESLKLKDEQIANLNTHLQNTTDKVKSGSATDFDILTTQVKVSAVQNQKIDIENEIKKQEIQLKTLMGMTPDAPINVVGDFNYTKMSQNADSLVMLALHDRSDLKVARDNEMTAQFQRLNARKYDMPSLNFQFEYGIKNGFIPNIDVLRGNFAAAVSFKYPIYNGSKEDALEQEADANMSSSRSHSDEVESNIRSEVTKALSDLSSLEVQLDNIKVQIDQAAKSVERSEIQYREGTLRNLDLLDAQTNLSEAKLSRLQIIFRNIMADYSLQHAIGKKIW